MTRATFFRRGSLVLAAFTLACGDGTGPGRLTQDQVGDMLEAMSLVSYSGEMPGAAMRSASLRAAPPQTLNATVSVSQTVSCPNGGSAGVNGTATDDPAAGTSSAVVTQSFSDCSATSSTGRVWTFNGSVVTNVNSTYNETTGAFSINVTQVGGINYASNLGSGGCQVDLTMTMSGNANSLSATLSGTACGHTIEQSIEVTQ